MTKKRFNFSKASAWDKYAYGAERGNWNLCRAVCTGLGCGPIMSEGKLIGYSAAESKLLWEMYEVACSSSRSTKWPELREKLLDKRMITLP